MKATSKVPADVQVKYPNRTCWEPRDDGYVLLGGIRRCGLYADPLDRDPRDQKPRCRSHLQVRQPTPSPEALRRMAQLDAARAGEKTSGRKLRGSVRKEPQKPGATEKAAASKGRGVQA